MSSVTSFRAKQAALSYRTTAVTWDSSTDIEDEAGFTTIKSFKDMELTPSEMAYEQILTMGATAQTVGANAQTIGTATGVVAGKFQNAAVQQTAVGMWMLTGTIVTTGSESFAEELGLDAGSSIDSNTRYAVGNLNTSTNAWAGRTTVGAFRIAWNNGTQVQSAVLTNPYVKLRPIRPTGADGHYEQDVEISCLPKDGALEWN